VFHVTPAGVGTVLHSFGTVFRLTPTGVKTTLYSFGPFRQNPTKPMAGVIEGSDGAFYGITENSSQFDGSGTVFRMVVQ
jgi:hypothetical protein